MIALNSVKPWRAAFRLLAYAFHWRFYLRPHAFNDAQRLRMPSARCYCAPLQKLTILLAKW